MIKDVVFYTFGGLGLFLFGMKLMSDGLKAVAGQKLKRILEAMTNRTLVAFMVGAAVTALVQSSSATTVMVIGFINAGLLTLKQGICVIIGTNVGTTATAWLVSISGLAAFKIAAYAMPGVALGFLLTVGGRTRRAKNIGQILLGFGILFLGIDFMKEAFAPVENSAGVQRLFVTMGSQPALAMLAGAVVTMLLQSSSASIAIIQVLAMQKAFGSDWALALNVAIPFVLGCNIGTTITAQLAALQANVNARRAAWAHTIFNLGGSLIAYPFVYIGWFGALVDIVSPWGLNEYTIGPSIAVAHTVFNVLNSGVFLPFAEVLARLVTRLVPGRPGDMAVRSVILERHLLGTPEIALEQAQREIIHMARTAKEAIHAAIDGLLDGDPRQLKSVRELEDYTDTFQFEITSYLSELSSRQLSDEVSVELPVLLHTVNDLERVGDHAVNIAQIADRKIEQRLNFTDSALREATLLKQEVEQMFDRVIDSLERKSMEAAKSAIPNELRLNRMQVELRRSHVSRMREGACSPEAGLIFIDLVDNVEKVGDHLTNIAQAVIGGLQWAGIEPKAAPGPRYDEDEFTVEEA
jgi:phosphate:Na+ symporter